MRVIIVDDAIQTVKAIKLSIDWNKLGVSEVYTAHNISQAKEILSLHEVHIAISDIEMPNGSGLELIKWMKDNSPKTESILLTCHAEFEYAKMAIELGSFDYLVKPIPFEKLEKIVSKLIVKIEAGRKLVKQSECWMDNQPLVEEGFWYDLLTGEISSDAASIESYARKRSVSYRSNLKYLLILSTRKRVIANLQDWDESSIMFALKNISNDVILQGIQSGFVLAMDDKIIAVVSSENGNEPHIEDIKKNYVQYALACNKYLGCTIASYVGKYVSGEYLKETFEKLQDMDKNNVSFVSKIFDSNSNKLDEGNEKEILMPNLKEWSIMLYNGESDAAIREVIKYIDDLVKAEKIDGKLLKRLHQDILQMLYSFLEQKGIQAHQLFDNAESEKLYNKATKSVDGAINWVTYYFNKSISYIEEVTKSQTVIEKVKSYIKDNYDKDISRDDIANYVFLNPDYLSRTFKKATGFSLSEYLTEVRIEKSMKLLVSSNTQISNIAFEVGYNNMNYFSKMFKKVSGVSPVDYRKKYQEKT
jgi:two-component system, response regulator YesN